MIIKIDHVCYTCARGNEKEILASNPSYKVLFKEENLKNLDIKRGCSYYENKVHDIIYLEAEGQIPIEITEYPNIDSGENGLTFESEISRLCVPTDNLQESVEFFKFCGAKIFEQDMVQAKGTIKGILDRKSLNIELRLAEQRHDWVLDRRGVCCMALVVKDIEAERRKWLERYTATEIRELNVNGRNLKIFFGKGNCGETIEIISL